MVEPKYVIATIKLPIEMLADGTFKTHADRADIGFVPCGSLPPINTELNSSAFDKLQELIGLKKSTETTIEINDSPMFVFKKIDEIGEFHRLTPLSGQNVHKELSRSPSDATTSDDINPDSANRNVEVMQELCNSDVNATVCALDEPVEPLESVESNDSVAIINEVLKLFIKKDEMNQNTKRSLSTTFKTYPKSNHNFSSKKRS
jgi:hypothetical protein